MRSGVDVYGLSEHVCKIFTLIYVSQNIILVMGLQDY